MIVITHLPSCVTRGWAGWALRPGEIILEGNYCKIGGNKRLKERGKAEREEEKQWGQREA